MKLSVVTNALTIAIAMVKEIAQGIHFLILNNFLIIEVVGAKEPLERFQKIYNVKFVAME